MSNKQVIRPKHIRAGITIYRISVIGDYIETIVVASRPYKINLGFVSSPATFADQLCYSSFSRETYKNQFSLKDAGIVPNSYNMSKTFSTKRAAQRYLNEVKKSPEYEKMMKRHRQLTEELDWSDDEEYMYD